jgi:stage V sporulation protein D (sporulation-specific penicillin-binding protein)
LEPSKVGPVELATISFGQGISVTPVQLISSLATVANDGKLVQPHVAKEITDKDGKTIHEFSSGSLRQVISYDTAQEMKKILESVVTNGTGGRGKIEGYRVAGKTGTAEKYVPGKYVVSYMGFAPADDPKLAILVIIDEPSGGLIYGGTIAGPVFQKVMADSLNYLGIKPEIAPAEDNDNNIKVPDLRNLFIEDAKKILLQNSLSARVEGEGYVVTEQVPLPGAEVRRNSTVILKVSDSRTNKDPVTIPDLKGRTVKESTDIINAIGLNIEILGSGYAVKQNPPPEVEVGLGTTVRVEFSQKP